MRRTAVARGRSRRQDASGVSLFPFLAVLICTMGALIVLLVVITRQARLQAAEAVRDETPTADPEAAAELEMVRWRVSEMKAAREKTESQLAESRLQLGHIEDHARRLRDELIQLETAWARLDKVESDGGQRRRHLQSELDRLRAELAEAQRLLAEARLAAKRRRKSYAVVPYQGPNATHRQPIYIECRADSVVLQPEGILLTEVDFNGPLGPGNPLAAALRAKREYLNSQQHGDDKQQIEPYPLLLVRPDGISAYLAARAAMKSWGSEFGYELIEEDWKLEFQPRDPRLAEIVKQVIDNARVRQQRLAAAAPRSYRPGQRTFYTVSPNGGGVVPYGGSPGSPSSRSRTPKRGFGSGNNFGRGGGFGRGSGNGFGSGSDRPGSPGTGQSDLGAPGQPGTPAGTHDGSTGTGGGTSGDSGMSNGRPDNGGTGNGSGQTHGTGTGGPATSDGGHGNSDTGSTGGSAGSTGNGREGLTGSNQPGGPHPTERGQPDAFGKPGMMAQAGQTGSPGGGEGSGQAGHAGQGGQPGKSGQPGSGQSGSAGTKQSMGMPTINTAQQLRREPRKLGSLAQSRGRDWGLPDSGGGAVPITRPVRVDCHADRLVIVPERGLGGGHEIPMRPRTEQSVDELVSAVWRQIDNWGMAGRGMYWRPILNFHVAPGAESRYAELRDLLEGSGLKVQKKE